MKRKLFFLIVFFILVIAAWSIVFISERKQSDREFLSSIQLVGIRDDLKLWELSDDTSSVKLKETISKSILRKVILVRVASPDVTKIDGEALETLCILSENKNILNSASKPQLAKTAKEYLSSVEVDVKSEIAKLQKVMKGKGCLISPNP